MLADLDHFKPINDSYGHFVGDEVLRETAKRLDLLADGRSTVVGRFGGDEFAIVTLSPESELLDIAERIRESVAAIDDIEGLERKVSVSIGIARAWGTDLRAGGIDSLPQLLNDADRALYSAKTTGRNRFVVA